MKKILATHGTKCPPAMGDSARREAGRLLKAVQCGVRLSAPVSRSIRENGQRARELRIQDQDTAWRVVYQVKPDAVILRKIEPMAGGAA